MTKAEVFGSSRTDGNSQNGQTSAQVVARIRTMITRGDLHPGDRLPAERELSKQLGISRPSLRAGIRTLVALGVLQS
ncbi:MAG TPA: GntR family transcriptional regulator, partial [Blastocatellia bacterium]|nr:GntR family transcriptional regulator [Blastocatellia bacterium]